MRSQDAYAGLYRDETSALTLLATALEKLTQLTSLDASQQHLQADLQQSYYLIEEVARSLLAYGERMDVDPARLQAVEDRLTRLRACSGNMARPFPLFSSIMRNFNASTRTGNGTVSVSVN